MELFFWFLLFVRVDGWFWFVECCRVNFVSCGVCLFFFFLGEREVVFCWSGVFLVWCFLERWFLFGWRRCRVSVCVSFWGGVVVGRGGGSGGGRGLWWLCV